MGDRVFVTSEVGDLVDVDASTGQGLVEIATRRSSSAIPPRFMPTASIYAPILNAPGSSAAAAGEESASGGHGVLYVIVPGDAEGKIVSQIVLDGRCYGTPTAYRGRIYMQTTKKLYCFGPAKAPDCRRPKPRRGEKWPAPGPAARLQAIPSEILMQPGGAASLRVRSLDANGLTVEEISDPQRIAMGVLRAADGEGEVGR